jgi:hypothetical protein
MVARAATQARNDIRSAETAIKSAHTVRAVESALTSASTALANARRSGDRALVRALELEYASVRRQAEAKSREITAFEHQQAEAHIRLGQTIAGSDRLAPQHLGVRRDGLDIADATAVPTSQSSGAIGAVESAIYEHETEYLGHTPGDREIVRVTAENGLTYSFDATPSPAQHEPDNRVVAVWGVSGRPVGPRDAVRLRGFPSPSGKSTEPLDRGHLAAHCFGGEEEGINLIPQDRDLNRGWSDEGRIWRRLENDLSARPGTQFFVRPIYDDNSDFPAFIEFGVQQGDGRWDAHVFRNR